MQRQLNIVNEISVDSLSVSQFIGLEENIYVHCIVNCVSSEAIHLMNLISITGSIEQKREGQYITYGEGDWEETGDVLVIFFILLWFVLISIYLQCTKEYSVVFFVFILPIVFFLRVYSSVFLLLLTYMY